MAGYRYVASDVFGSLSPRVLLLEAPFSCRHAHLFRYLTMRALPCFFALLLAALMTAPPLPAQDNPPAEGFNLAASDARAVELADQAMRNMGGRQNWDNTRILAWTLFGRDHVWDKWTGDFRMQNDSLVVLMNVNTKRGRAWKNGREVTEAAARDALLETAYGSWVNEGYWFLMPFKLKDSGVTLKHLGDDALQDGRAADLLQLTFENVGLTPQNKYHVWIGKDTGLVEQWAFYRNAGDAEPSFMRPWTDYRRFGTVLLAINRGEGRDGQPLNMQNVAVLDEPMPGLFDDPAPIDLAALARGQ